MKRPLALAALAGLAIGVLAPGSGIRDAAPSIYAQGTTTATPAATTALACTDATLGGTGALAANPKLAADCNTLLALRYKLSGPDTLNWSPAVALARWDGVTVSGTPKRVTRLSLTPYAFTLADLASLDGIVTLRLDTYTTPETPATATTPRTPRTARTAWTPTTARTALPASSRICITTTLGGSRTANAVLARDCDTLLAIKSTLEGTLPAGTAPLNWSPALALTRWDGVDISSSGTKRVTALALNEKGLSGSIPTQIGSLTGLTILELARNQLTGNIPTQIGNLPALTSLILNNNQLSGSIPTQIGDLITLTELDLSDNQLTGVIPTQIGNLTALTSLVLGTGSGNGTNRLSGSIPTQLGNLTALTVLRINGKQGHNGKINTDRLTGVIPTQLGKLTNLTSLTLGYNFLSGKIPTQLGNLSNLERLWLVDNQLTGSIPTQLGNLTSLGNLNLLSNQLTGEIPTQLGNLTELYKLVLQYNRITGHIPTQLGNLPLMRDLRLNGGWLSGGIPPQLGSLTALTRVGLSATHTGCLPDALSRVERKRLPDLPLCSSATPPPTPPPPFTLAPAIILPPTPKDPGD